MDDPSFHEETRSLVLQEMWIRQVPDTSMLPQRPPLPIQLNAYLKKLLKPVLVAVAGLILATPLLYRLSPDPVMPALINRFVIYEPAAGRVELIGSFTGWQRTPLLPIGSTGYRELQLEVPSGEHRFSYIIDGNRRIADPTYPIREQDDFGGENSILHVEQTT